MPSRRTPRKQPANSPRQQDSLPSNYVHCDEDDNESTFSDLAQPLPSSSPANSQSQRSTADSQLVNMADVGSLQPSSSEAASERRTGGPGSVIISEIDLSSPLNYGAPLSNLGSGLGSVGTSGGFRTPRTNLGDGSVAPATTPLRLRSDIQSGSVLRQVNISPMTPAAQTENQCSQNPQSASQQSVDVPSQEGPSLHIWGTDVNIQIVKNKFTSFLSTFKKADARNGDKLIYMIKLDEIEMLGLPYLDVDMLDLKSFDEDVYRQLVCYPQEVIPAMDMSVNILFANRFPETALPHQILVRPFNADKTKNMRSLDPEDIDQLITVCGMVIRSSNIVPEMCEALFQCSVCKATRTSAVERGRIQEPTLCTHCQTNHSFALVHNRSMFQDKQMVKLQEAPDDMPAGQTPHTVVLFAHDAMVDSVQPGDRVAVTGIYRAIPARVSPIVRNVRSIYRTHIDVLHFHVLGNSNKTDENNDDAVVSEALFSQLSSDEAFNTETVSRIESLASRPDAYEILARTLAPSIYGNEDVKKGVLLQLFGGAAKDLSETGRGGRFRSEINILLCGDPGTSKSQLLQYVYNLVPRSQYTSGKGSSAVGLTAYVTKDPETRQLVLQTGALVLADNGVCCIDEFDKMSDSARSVLHEVMESQTLSIAKAGIICQLNARASVLAAANPIESQWNPRKTIVENIQLPHTLLSRFDLIFLILDPQDEVYDRRLGRHLVALYYETSGKKVDGSRPSNDDLVDLESGGLRVTSLLREYIAYAKAMHPSPRLSDEAGTLLVQNYVAMRQFGSGRGQITAFPRQLESLIRLSEAHAKMRLSSTVEVKDVQEATRLHKEALKQAATDPLSGRIDISILTTGQSEGTRRRRHDLKEALKNIVDEKKKNAGPANRAALHSINYLKLWNELKECSDLTITRDMFDDALKDLSDDRLITVTSRSTIRIN